MQLVYLDDVAKDSLDKVGTSTGCQDMTVEWGQVALHVEFQIKHTMKL